MAQANKSYGEDNYKMETGITKCTYRIWLFRFLRLLVIKLKSYFLKLHILPNPPKLKIKISIPAQAIQIKNEKPVIQNDDPCSKSRYKKGLSRTEKVTPIIKSYPVYPNVWIYGGRISLLEWTFSEFETFFVSTL